MCTMEIKQSVFERRMAVYTAEMWQKSWMNEFKWALDAQAASRGGLRTSLSNTARRRHGNVCRCTITMLCLTKRSSARATVASNLPSARRHIAARSRRAAPRRRRRRSRQRSIVVDRICVRSSRSSSLRRLVLLSQSPRAAVNWQCWQWRHHLGAAAWRLNSLPFTENCSFALQWIATIFRQYFDAK